MQHAEQQNNQYQHDAENFEKIIKVLEEVLKIAELVVDKEKLAPLKNFLKDVEKFKTICQFLAAQARELYKNRHKVSKVASKSYHEMTQKLEDVTQHFLRANNFPKGAMDFKKRGMSTTDYLLKVWSNVVAIFSWGCDVFAHVKKDLSKNQTKSRRPTLMITDFAQAQEVLSSVSGYELENLPKNRSLSFSTSDNNGHSNPANIKNPNA